MQNRLRRGIFLNAPVSGHKKTQPFDWVKH